ncbi:MAG: cytochrome c family protein [Candidatus Marinimicrobia bacterium]|nr:cytochrome c family protein [Candidatus Neomarinimicrobiota bacterium]
MKKLIITLLTLSVFILAQGFEYVGNASCKMCHNKDAKGAQYSKWEAGPHAKAFETLKSEKATKIAKGKGITVEAWKAPECLKCHTTGFGAGGYEVKCDAFWNPKADDKDGAKAVKRMEGLQAVGCEACHGAGSEYKSSKTMAAIHNGETDGKTVGLTKIDKTTCLVCHNEKSPTYKPFNYEVRIKEVQHPMPSN